MRSQSPDDCQKIFCRYYRNQIGGGLPVFHGADQYGEGLGDILRGVFRFLLPIASSAASKFITSTSSGIDAGQSLTQAAKSAILPTVGEAIWGVGKEALAKHRGMASADQNVHVWSPEKEQAVRQQSGKGYKLRKRAKIVKRKPKSRRTHKLPKLGVNQQTRKRKRVYKAKSRKQKRIRVLPTNF